ncbi:MAG: hypothetical protein Q9219_000787 [cf. Caloplaca sp. 3 TL-2023]
MNGDPPARGLSNQQNGISRQALLGSTHPKVSKLPQRNAPQDPTRLTSSVPFADANSSTNGPISEEVRHIQRKLLHLYALYSASAGIHAQWRESAKMYFQGIFEDLVARHVDIADIAYQTQELKNRSALVEWSGNIQPHELERRVRMFSKCVEEIHEYLDVGGKYLQVTSSFETWFNRAREIQTSRTPGTIADTSKITHVETIGPKWQDDVDVFQRKLSNLTGDLRTLGSASVSSNLGQLLVLLQGFVIDMLAEVDCIRSIECEVVAQEDAWIEEQVRSLTSIARNKMEENRKTPRKTPKKGFSK